MTVFRKETEQQQLQAGISNLDVLLSTRASEATLLAVLQSLGSSNPEGGALNQEATQLIIKTCLDLILDSVNAVKDTSSFEGKLLQVDCVGNTTYIGYADAGSSTGASSWAIKRWIETGPDSSASWADGDKDFNNIWDDRLILSYS